MVRLDHGRGRAAFGAVLVAGALMVSPPPTFASPEAEVTGRWSGTDSDASDGASSATTWEGVATIERRGSDEYTLVYEVVQQSEFFDHEGCSSTAVTTGEATTTPEENGRLLFTGEAVTDIVSSCEFYESRGGTDQAISERTTVGYLMEGDVIRLDLLPATSIEMQPEMEVQVDDGTSGVTILDDGTILINSPPDGSVLSLTDADLPAGLTLPIATVGAMAANACWPDTIISGDNRVLLNGVPIARLGDKTAMGGAIVSGDTKILVNGKPAATMTSMTVNPMVSMTRVPCVGGPITTGVAPTGTDWIDDVIGGDEEALERLRERMRSLKVEEYPEEMAATETAEDAAAGGTVIEGNFEAYEVGDGVSIGTDPVDIGIVESKGSIVLDRPLIHDHPAGTIVTRIDADIIVQARDQIESGTDPVTDVATESAPAATAESSPGTDESSFPTVLVIALLGALVAVGGGAALYLRRRDQH